MSARDKRQLIHYNYKTVRKHIYNINKNIQLKLIRVLIYNLLLVPEKYFVD